MPQTIIKAHLRLGTLFRHYGEVMTAYAASAFILRLMLWTQQVVDGLDRVECFSGNFNK